VARWPVLVAHAAQHLVSGEVAQPLGEDLARDPELGHELVEASPATGDLPQHEQVPPVAHDGGGVRDAARLVDAALPGGHVANPSRSICTAHPAVE